MPAFRPTPTDSTIRLATWLFFRVIGAIVAGFVAFVAVANAPIFWSHRLVVAQVIAFLLALWLGLVMLFEALDVFLDAKLESVREGPDGDGSDDDGPDSGGPDGGEPDRGD